MIGILVATRGEAAVLLKNAHGTKKDGIYYYRSKICGRETALYLTRPGIPSKEQLRRFLRLYPFDAIISTGSAASLTTEFAHLQAVVITEAIRIASVSQLVATDSDKAEIRTRTNAVLLDMETETIQHILKEEEFVKLKCLAIRVVDDLPGEENYLKKEKQLRDLTFGRAKHRLSWVEVVRFGIWDYVRILWRRHQVATAIWHAAQTGIRSVK